MTRIGTGIAVAALLVAPLMWSGYSTLYAGSGGIPSAGPQTAGTSAGFGGPERVSNAIDGQTPPAGMPSLGGTMTGQASTELIKFLEANQGSATYLVATSNSQTAASIILASNEPVMSLGGFTGSDPILTVEQFASLVESGQIRYVLANGGGPGGPGGPGGGSSAIMSWVQANGAPVTITSSAGSQTQVYDLGSLQGPAA